MNSPFLFQNISVLLLLTVIFAGGLYLLLSKKVSNFIGTRSIISLVLYRAATTVVFSFIFLGFLVGISLFYFIEIDDLSRDCWKRTYQWQTIVPGMPREQVAAIMGKPFLSYKAENNEHSTYCINPIGSLENGTIIFKPDINKSGTTVLSKTPDDEAILENLHGWIPDKSSKTYANYAEIISVSGAFCAFYGLFGLALLTLYPFKLSELFALRMIYTPLAALLMKAIYENHQAADWHFELFSISPLLTVILVGWIIRVMVILAPD